MKNKTRLAGFTLLLCIAFQSCLKILDKSPFNILPEDEVLTTESGVEAYMASLYNLLPIEDFNFSPRAGFNVWNSSTFLSHLSEEALASAGDAQTTIGNGEWLPYWPYNGVRNVNNLIAKLPSTSLSTSAKNTFMGEAKFVRAYYYFGMVKRYGGVPLITQVQQFTPGDIASLQVPRNTEKEIYDFIARELDEAAELLPAVNGKGKANKTTAWALKSRAMVYAASIAKYGTPDLDGIVGIPPADANTYWTAAFNAAEKVLEDTRYALYNARPDKAENFQQLFLDQNNSEVIFAKYFVYPEKAHSYDLWRLPFAVRSPDGYGSREGPTLEMAEAFEYVDGTPGTLKLVDNSGNPIYYADPVDIFANKDPRFFATILHPFADWRGTAIEVRAGLIDGGTEVTAGNYNTLYNPDTHQIDNVNGTIHIIGLNGIGGGTELSQTGFYIKKYLNPAYERSTVRGWTSTQAYIDLRLGEVLLNYAEAAIELNDVPSAKWAINQIRERAGIRLLNDAEVTRDKVRHERMVELAFESHRYWDLRRWRLADQVLNNTSFSAILPYLDLDANAYIFRRKPVGYTKTFHARMYYEKISTGEIDKNPKLVQNPNY